MSTLAVILIVVAVLLLLGGAALILRTRRRSAELHERFGPEYDRTIATSQDRREAERELSDRAERREGLAIRPLSAESRERYSERWQAAQARFVDDPGGAVSDADGLVQGVMEERGYPVGHDFEARAADVSLDHPDVVEHYREGHRIAGSREPGTEDLRQAMHHFRALFSELLDQGAPDTERVAAVAPDRFENR